MIIYSILLKNSQVSSLYDYFYLDYNATTMKITEIVHNYYSFQMFFTDEKKYTIIILIHFYYFKM